MGSGFARVEHPPIAGSILHESTVQYVNWGSDESIMDLHAGDFTVDVYVYIPSDIGYSPNRFAAYSNGSDDDGMCIEYGRGARRAYLNVKDGNGVYKNASTGQFGPPAAANWYYLRGRRSGEVISIQIGGGTVYTTSGVVGYTTESSPLLTDMTDDTQICYLHIWNNDQGQLSSTPTSPFAVCANTVLRAVFSEEGGNIIVDSSNYKNHGTNVNSVWSSFVPSTWSLS